MSKEKEVICKFFRGKDTSIAIKINENCGNWKIFDDEIYVSTKSVYKSIVYSVKKNELEAMTFGC